MRFSGTRIDGISILEVVFTVGIVGFGLGAVYTMHWRTLQILRQAHRSVNASQVLQEKAEILRELPWATLTGTAAGTVLSGTGYLGQPITQNELQLQDASSLEEWIVVSGTPGGGGYSIQRTLNYNSGPKAVTTLSGTSAFSSPSQLNAHLTISWVTSGTNRYSRDFEMVISNPPQ